MKASVSVLFVLASLVQFPALGQVTDGGHFAFVFRSDIGVSVFTVTKQEEKRLYPNADFQSLHNADNLERIGVEKYSALLKQEDFPIVGEKGTEWFLCYRTNSPWVGNNGGMSQGQINYCFVSKEAFAKAHAAGGEIIRGTDTIAISNLCTIAVLTTGFKELDWSRKLFEVGGVYTTNGDLDKYATIGVQGGVEPYVPWLAMAKDINTGLITFGPDQISFQYIANNGLVKAAVADNQKSEESFTQITNRITQKVAEIEQTARQQATKAKEPPFSILFCFSAFFVGVSCLGFAWKDRATVSPSVFNLKKISFALGLGLVPFAFYQNPLVGIGIPIACLIFFLKDNGCVCPSCSRLVEAVPMAMELVDGHVKYRDVKRKEHVKNQRGETVFTLERDETVPIEVKTHRHHYKCPICQHQWTKLKTTESQP